MAVVDQFKRHRQLLAIANNELQSKRAGWTDDDYRELLRQCGASEKQGRISSTTMTIEEMSAALSLLKKMGFKPKKSNNNNDWRWPRIQKMYAIWCEMHAQGRVKNKSQQAMETWCKGNITGLSALQWATSDQLNRAIEMLKKFSGRA